MYPGLTGCMTKMVIGKGCCDKYEITRDDMNEAKRRIKEDFAFVGMYSVSSLYYFLHIHIYTCLHTYILTCVHIFLI